MSFAGLRVNEPARGAVGTVGLVSLSVLACGRVDHE